jgi:hypothetical protein
MWKKNMNTKTSIASIIYSLKKLDQQRHFKIADKIFNNLRLAQEVEEKVKAKTYDQLLNEMRQYAVSPQALKAGYRSLVFKYHPDRNNSSPIANENLIQLEKVYGRLRASLQSNLKEDNKYLKNLPIKNLNAEITITIFDNGHEYTDDFDMDESQIIEKYIDFLKYTRYWRTVGEPGKEAPARISFTEADIHGILESILEYASEQDENIIEVKVDLYYEDHNGNEKMVGEIGLYREGLIEEYEERTKYLSDDDDDDDDGIRRLN